MQGLELSEAYFYEYGLPMLKENFADILERLAIGLIGHGSECFGFDDDVSIDHDYEIGFIIFIDDIDYQKYGFKLERAYNSLPKTYQGIKIKQKNFYGNQYKGVKKISEFLSFYLPNGKIPNDLNSWMMIDDFYLAELCNGKIFIDNLGVISKIREDIKNRPNDIRLKKLASSLFYAGQYGQYNYERCLKHQENNAAIYALANFAKYVAEAIFLINNSFAPYYKWLFKGLRNLSILGNIESELQIILANPLDYNKNIKIIENIAKEIVLELNAQKLSFSDDNYLTAQAYAINNKISDFNLKENYII